jgi:hypothetical protein
MFNSEIGLLKRASCSTVLRVRAISESAPGYQRLCFGSDLRKNVQADIDWALRDEIPNWTGLYSELDDPILRKQPLEGLIPIDCSYSRAVRSRRDSTLVAGS